MKAAIRIEKLTDALEWCLGHGVIGYLDRFGHPVYDAMLDGEMQEMHPSIHIKAQLDPCVRGSKLNGAEVALSRRDYSKTHIKPLPQYGDADFEAFAADHPELQSICAGFNVAIRKRDEDIAAINDANLELQRKAKEHWTSHAALNSKILRLEEELTLQTLLGGKDKIKELEQELASSKATTEEVCKALRDKWAEHGKSAECEAYMNMLVKILVAHNTSSGVDLDKVCEEIANMLVHWHPVAAENMTEDVTEDVHTILKCGGCGAEYGEEHDGDCQAIDIL